MVAITIERSVCDCDDTDSRITVHTATKRPDVLLNIHPTDKKTEAGLVIQDGDQRTVSGIDLVKDIHIDIHGVNGVCMHMDINAINIDANRSVKDYISTVIDVLAYYLGRMSDTRIDIRRGVEANGQQQALRKIIGAAITEGEVGNG